MEKTLLHPSPQRLAAGELDYNVPGLERGMLALECLARNREGMSLMELATALDLPANSVLRLVCTLVRMGYLHRDEDTRRVVLTRRMLAVGYAAVHEYNIVDKAMEPLKQLRSEIRETVALAVLMADEGKGMVLVHLDCLHPFGFRMTDGMRFDLHSTGPGKVLLAFLPEDERNGLLARLPLIRRTRNTITGQAAFAEEMAAIRAQGHSLDREEDVIGCACVGAPVFDERQQLIAAVWTTGPADRLTEPLFATAAEAVKACARRITERLSIPS